MSCHICSKKNFPTLVVLLYMYVIHDIGGGICTYGLRLLSTLFSTFKKILHSIYHLISDITYGFEV